MLIYGAGGHARIMLSILRETGVPISGIFDDHIIGHLQGIRIFGAYDPLLFPDEPIVLAIGDNGHRRKVSEFVHHGFGQIVHSSAVIDAHVMVGDGCVIGHQAVIQAGVGIGKHVIVNTGCIIEHDCMLGNFTHIAPGAVLCGQVKIGENTLVGAGSTICPNLCIGKNCFIAAGSVVTGNLPDGCIVRGNPARIIKCTAP